MGELDMEFKDWSIGELEDEKMYIPHTYLPWAILLIDAWKEAKGSAQFLADGFWEDYSALDATTLLYELLMAARGEKLPHHPGQRALDQFHHDLTGALTAFYCLTVPVAEWVELVWEGGVG